MIYGRCYRHPEIILALNTPSLSLRILELNALALRCWNYTLWHWGVGIKRFGTEELEWKALALRCWNYTLWHWGVGIKRFGTEELEWKALALRCWNEKLWHWGVGIKRSGTEVLILTHYHSFILPMNATNLLLDWYNFSSDDELKSTPEWRKYSY